MNTLLCYTSVPMAAEAISCVLFKEFIEPDEIRLNTILQNMLNVTVTAFAVQNSREPHNRVKGMWKLMVGCEIIVIQHLPHISG